MALLQCGYVLRCVHQQWAVEEQHGLERRGSETSVWDALLSATFVLQEAKGLTLFQHLVQLEALLSGVSSLTQHT